MSTHEPLRASVNATHIRRDVVDESRVREICARFTCHVDTPLVDGRNECSASKQTRLHGPPEELVLRDTGRHGRTEQSDGHADARTNAGDRLSRSFCRSACFAEVNNGL